MVAIYRSGSRNVSELFFEELSSLLELLETYNATLWVVGDINIHLERPEDIHCQWLQETIKAHNLR